MLRPVMLALCLLASLAPLPAQAGPKNVLILHSYQHDMEWTRLMHAGMVMELESGENPTALIKTEYMDAKRAWNDDLARRFAAYLSLRYSQAGVDLVLVSDNDAYDFMLEYGGAVFGDAPFVFAGVNDFDPSALEGLRPRATGVVEHIDYRATLNAILLLFPELTDLKVLADSSTTGIKTLKEFLKAAEDIGFPLAISVFPDAPFSDIVAEASLLGPSAGVIMLAYARDKAGLAWSLGGVTERLSEASAGPVFGVWDFYMGKGIVGGALTSGLAQGRAAGRMAMRILNGEQPASISIDDVRSPPFSVDWRQLRRFGVPMGRLPAGTVVLYKPLSLFARDPQVFLALAGLIAIVVLLGASLGLTRLAYTRLRASEARLSSSLKEKESLMRELHHRVKNSFQLMTSLLSLQAGSIKDEETKRALIDSENRIRSMALVHAELYEERNLAAIDLSSYARSLAGYLTSCYAAKAPKASFEHRGEGLFLDLERAIPLGLVLNELMSNSLKHACDASGRCRMTLVTTRGDEGRYILRYSDDGPGLPSAARLEELGTLGMQLITVLSQQLGARLTRDEGDASGFIIELAPDAPPA